MKFVAFDVETHRIQPGLLAPPVVCASVYDGKDDALFYPYIADFWLETALQDDNTCIVGANIAYDFTCMLARAPHLAKLVFEKYKKGLVFDILIAEMLHAIAKGTLGIDPRTGAPFSKGVWYSLDTLSDWNLGVKDAKANDEYRLRYHELEGIPFEQWPVTARTYPIDDVRNTWRNALKQLGKDGAPKWQNLHDLPVQAFASFCLHLGATWGLRADRESVEILESTIKRLSAENDKKFWGLGFLRLNADGTYSENQSRVKKAVAIAYGSDPFSKCRALACLDGRIPTTTPKGQASTATCPQCDGTGLSLSLTVPRTDKGGIRLNADTLNESGDKLLTEYATSQENDKVAQTYLPFLKQAVEQPVTLKPSNPLETGRVSYRDPSQTFPRYVKPSLAKALKECNAPITGVRDCIVPRPGFVFFSNDYTGGELVTFAESCIHRVGFSEMGKALLSGIDVHSALAAQMLGIPYDEFIEWKDKKHGIAKAKLADLYRQAAKPENFGNPGGMGELRKVIQQRVQGPDTPHPSGPSLVLNDAGDFVPGYKGLRFCILTGAERCGEIKVQEWKKKPCPPLCLACLKAAEAGRNAWFARWSEARPYLAWHSKNSKERGYIEQIYSKRIRGGTEYTSESNGDFQALLGDIAKRALIRVVTEQYTEPSSPLWGSRVILFLHDELFGEAPEERGHEVSMRVNEIMVEEFRKGCPYHAKACKAEPTLMRRWRKEAKPVYKHGRLIPWEDRNQLLAA